MTSLPTISEAEDRDRLPVALLSGFLGSGKTTLVNALLADPRMAETAVAINEFGAVPLDQHLIPNSPAGRDSTVVMANGCLCCNLAGDLEEAVLRLFTRRQTGELPTFARLIVEPSGFADPAPIAQAILRNPLMARVLRLDAIVTVVDAAFAPRQLDTQPESAPQIRLADRIVLTKTDLAPDTAALRARLTRLNPTAPVFDVRHGAIDPGLLFTPHFLDVRTTTLPDLPPTPHAHTHAHTHHGHGSDTEAVALTADQPLPWRAFEAWLRSCRLGFADRLLRVKGLVAIEGQPGPIVIQGVHHVLHAPVQRETWPDADHRTRVVMIVRGVDTAALRASFAELCQAHAQNKMI